MWMLIMSYEKIKDKEMFSKVITGEVINKVRTNQTDYALTEAIVIKVALLLEYCIINKFLNQAEQRFFRYSKKIVDVTISIYKCCCGDISHFFPVVAFLGSHTRYECTKFKAMN